MSQDFFNDGKENYDVLGVEEIEEILKTTNDLSGMDMRRAHLEEVDFSGCNLKGANLSYAILRGCNFKNSDLSGASLWNANLEEANLTGANLECCDLDYSKLRGAVLYQANIRRAQLPVDLIPREEIIESVEKGSPVAKKIY